MKIEHPSGGHLHLAGYRDLDGALRPDGCGEHCYYEHIQRGWTPLWVLDGAENNAMKWGTGPTGTPPGS